jgi:VWFA-related protein
LVTAVSITSRICAALLFSVAASTFAQQAERPILAPSAPPPPLPIDLPTSISYRMPDPAEGLIRVDVAVTDKFGKTVTGLSEKDFTLIDNNLPLKIVTFQAYDGAIAEPADSLEIVIVLDELNMLANERSGKVELSSASREVETFLRANGGVLGHPAIVYRLTNQGLFATAHASLDGNELAEQIEHSGDQHLIWNLPRISKDIGHIAIGGDASARIARSVIALGSIAIEERRKAGRKLLFWIGNGWQIEKRKAAGVSDFSIELLTRMREARINIWGASEWSLYDSAGNAVPVTDYAYREFLDRPKPDSTDLDYLSLPVIAARSGGGMLDTPRHLAALIREHVKQENSYYSFTFDPPRTSIIDEYHHLRLEIDKPGLTSHVFEDYYDEPVF